VADYPILVVVGPEFVTGSSRMKAGTAQKLTLNMLSTAIMIRMGRVQDNKMVDMQLTNVKLVDRGVRMVMEQTGLEYAQAEKLLLETGSARAAVAAFQQ
jgi:N-acetylmuramic acid 6-phosphate etherase